MRKIFTAAFVAVLVSYFAMPVHAQSTTSTTPINAAGNLTSAASSNAACTGSSCVSITGSITSQGQCWVEVDGTWSGTLIIEGSLNGTNWATQNNIVAYGGTTTAASITSDGLYSVPCAPSTTVRMSAYVSGTAYTQLYATPQVSSGGGASIGGGSTTITSPLPLPVAPTCSASGCPVNVQNSPAANVAVVPYPSPSPFPVACATPFSGSCPTPIPYPTATTGYLGATGEDVGSAGNVYPHTIPDAFATTAPVTSATTVTVIPAVTGQQIWVFGAFVESSGTNTNDSAQYNWGTAGTCSTLGALAFRPQIVNVNTLGAEQTDTFWGTGINGTVAIPGVDAPWAYPPGPVGQALCGTLSGGTAWAIIFKVHYAQR